MTLRHATKQAHSIDFIQVGVRQRDIGPLSIAATSLRHWYLGQLMMHHLGLLSMVEAANVRILTLGAIRLILVLHDWRWKLLLGIVIRKVITAIQKLLVL